MFSIRNFFILYIAYNFSNKISSEKLLCSRVDSGIVRKFIDEKIVPAYNKLGLHIPEQCIWHHERDVFGRQNSMIRKISEENWRCEFCGKDFYSEYYLWKHMEIRHSDHINTNNNSICLGNFCQIFRCEIINERFHKQAKTNWAQKLCNPSNMDKLRMECNEVIEHCVTNTMPSSDILRDYLQSTICNFLTCNNYWQISLKSSNWAFNLYMSIALFLCGLVIYYIALFVKLNKVETDRQNSRQILDNCHSHQHCNYRGAQLTFRGNRD